MTMAIRNWHVGKIVLLWVWASVLCGVLVQAIKGLAHEQFVTGFIFIGLFIVIAVVMSVVTWKWFSGKEH
jgi:hypothetical protein